MLLIRCPIGCAWSARLATSTAGLTRLMGGVMSVVSCGFAAARRTVRVCWSRRRLALADEVRERFVPTVPAGYVKLDAAARQLGVARQTMLNQVRAGRRNAVMVLDGRRRGLRIEIHPDEQALLELGTDR